MPRLPGGWWNRRSGGWRGRWHAQNWLAQPGALRVPAYRPSVRSRRSTAADVLEILTPIWHVKAETAQRRAPEQSASVLEWADGDGAPRADNPCDRVLPVLGPQNDIVTHRLALPHKEVAAAVETVRVSASAAPAVKLAFELLVLTAARSGEVRLATWDEIDAAGAVWTISAMRMKAKREHRVPRLPLVVSGLGVCGRLRKCKLFLRMVRSMRSGAVVCPASLIAACHAPRACMEIRGSGPKSAECAPRHSLSRWFSRPRLVDRLPLPSSDLLAFPTAPTISRLRR